MPSPPEDDAPPTQNSPPTTPSDNNKDLTKEDQQQQLRPASAIEELKSKLENRLLHHQNHQGVEDHNNFSILSEDCDNNKTTVQGEEVNLRAQREEEFNPDELQDSNVTSSVAAMIPEGQRGPSHHPPPPLLSEDGLIMPRKPPNPVKDNNDRQNLHKELMFNQKIGKNVLNQKSELQRALEKQKEHMAKKELENNKATRAPELEKVIADRAKRLQANTNDDKNEDDKVINKEFLQARMKLKNRSDSK